jgi:hypothetical protein
MLTYLRYALATFCFAASVGCVALWWRSYTISDAAFGPSPTPEHIIHFRAFRGSFAVGHLAPLIPAKALPISSWHYSVERISDDFELFDSRRRPIANFGRTNGGGFYFPLWYPALIVALAGIVSLRLDRRFTLRSAIITTTVVAGLLGMAVGL